MIWHIFRKDFRLLWPLSLSVVLLGVLCAVRPLLEGPFHQPLLERLMYFLPYLVYVGVAVVAMTAVHQDSLSGSQEDWLIRPVLRTDLALAKLLFVLLTVHVPLMTLDVAEQRALGFPLSVSLGVAGTRALMMAAMLSLPGLLLGAVTRSLVDAFAFAAAAAIGLTFLVLGTVAVLSAETLGLGRITGMEWIALGAACAAMTLGSIVGLVFQYSRRRAGTARVIGLLSVVVSLAVYNLLPGRTSLAVQDLLRGAAHPGSVRLRIDPSRPTRMRANESPFAYEAGSPAEPANVALRAAATAAAARHVERIPLPLAVSGLRPGDVLVADRIDLRVLASDGTPLFGEAGACAREVNGVVCLRHRLEVWARAREDEEGRYEAELILPVSLYARIKDEPVRIEIELVLSRFVARPSQTIAAAGERKALSQMGECATRIDESGSDVELGCVTNVGVPSCARIFLEDPETQRRNPALQVCSPEYAPYRRPRLTDAVMRSHLSLPIRDRSGSIAYPVDGNALGRARINLTAYEPAEHFRTSVVAPAVRLKDWAMPKGEPQTVR